MLMLRRLFVLPWLAAAALSLAACGSLPTVNLTNQVNLNTLDGVVAGYNIVLNAETALKQTPLCKTGTSPSLTNVCVKRSLIVRLQEKDRLANLAVNTAVAFVANHPSVSPTEYISAARDALSGVQAIINEASAATASPG